MLMDCESWWIEPCHSRLGHEQVQMHIAFEIHVDSSPEAPAYENRVRRWPSIHFLLAIERTNKAVLIKSIICEIKMSIPLHFRKITQNGRSLIIILIACHE